jgi:hypothetical protein
MWSAGQQEHRRDAEHRDPEREPQCVAEGADVPAASAAADHSSLEGAVEDHADQRDADRAAEL